MLRFVPLVFALVSFASEGHAMSPAICDGAFAKAATVEKNAIKFNVKRLACRSLRDGPRGFQLQCFSKRDSRIVADRIAASWANCLKSADFGESPQGQSERMKITEHHSPKHRVVCTLINSAREPGIQGWSVKIKCFGPR